MKLLYLMILLKNALKEVIGNLFQTTIEVYIPSTIQVVQAGIVTLSSLYRRWTRPLATMISCSSRPMRNINQKPMPEYAYT